MYNPHGTQINHYARFTPNFRGNTREIALRVKNLQNGSYSRICRQDHKFLLYYSEGHTFLLNTRKNPGKLSTELYKFRHRFNHRKRTWNLSILISSGQLAAGSSFGRTFLASWSWFIQGPCMSFGTVANRSQVIIENFLTWSYLSNFIGGE